MARNADDKIKGIDCEHLARKTGFIQRSHRKVSPLQLLQAFAVASFQPYCSFRALAALASVLCGQTVSKQAIAKRTQSQCVDFVRHALFALVGRISYGNALKERGLFTFFNRVLLQDSTTLSLPEHFAEHFQGPSNQCKKKQATMKIQAIYEFLSETFAHFSLSGFTRTDQAASADILNVAKQGDLVLRDLGYFVLSVFKKMQDRGIHFLSRLRLDVSVYDPLTQKAIDLLKELRIYGHLDRQVIIGAKERLSVRLVAIRLPDSVANQRRRKAKQNRDRRCNISKERLELLGWELFITSVPQSVWSPDNVGEVYRMRWRIEIIFKSWKSHFNLKHVPNGSATQLEALIWAQLLAICLFQPMFGAIDLYCCSKHNTSLSLLKIASLFPHLLIYPIISCNDPKLIIEILIKHFSVEKRRNRQPSLYGQAFLG